MIFLAQEVLKARYSSSHPKKITFVQQQISIVISIIAISNHCVSLLAKGNEA
jgi:hypothetical protein